MTPQDFNFIAALLKKHSGFSLVPGQLYLLENRMAPILRQNNLICLEDLVTSLKLNDVELRKSVVEAVSINNTRFFRNKYVFHTIENFLNKKFSEEKEINPIRILSAGCASGQEPVSIAILLHEMSLKDDVNLDIYALDMSRNIIEKAQKGIYTHYEVQKGLPTRLLLKYFSPHTNNHWRLNENISKQIHYRVHNLMNLFNETNFDIILCRNMLSFMTAEAQTIALQNLSQIINKNGVLIVGASEVLNANDFFEKIPNKIGCYRLKLTDTKKNVLPSNWSLKKKPLFKSALGQNKS